MQYVFFLRYQRPAPQVGPGRASGAPGACRGARCKSGSCGPLAPGPKLEPPRARAPAMATRIATSVKPAGRFTCRAPQSEAEQPPPRTAEDMAVPGATACVPFTAASNAAPATAVGPSPIRCMLAALPDSRHMDTKRVMCSYTICIIIMHAHNHPHTACYRCLTLPCAACSMP